MNRGYSYTPRGLARSPPRRDRLQSQDRSSSQKQSANQDINIDDFGDMGSDEDDFQPVSSNFLPPKPAKPVYNFVPHGFLRDDDCIEDDYDGVPIDDADVEESPKKQKWESSPHKQEAVRGAPITVLGSDNRRDSHFSAWPDTRPQEASRSRLGLGSSSSMATPISTVHSGGYRNVSSLMGSNPSTSKAQSFVRGNDDSNPFLKTANMNSSVDFVRSTDSSNPFIKDSKRSLSGSAASFVPTKDSSSSSQSHDSIPRWTDRPKPAESTSPAWSKQGPGITESLKGQIQLGQNTSFTPTCVANTSQLEILQQAAALQQALTGLTRLGSQSGLNLLGTQNLLLQASQNPALAAALVASGGLLNPGIGSIQPNALTNPAVEGLLKSTPTAVAPAAVPETSQINVGLLSYPLRSNVKPSLGSIPQKKTIPDGSGSTRYPAPDVSSLVFDPSTGYRFDSSTGLHYDANSGYFFNSELKIFLRWDKFTQTYLKVDNPPPIPRLMESSPVSFVKDPPLASQDRRTQSSSLTSPLQSSATNYGKDNLLGYPVRGVPPSSSRDIRPAQSSLITIPTDFSKPPPPLPQTLHSEAGFPSSVAKPPNVTEQKAATLPNYAETSLFNKLRKAKLAQTAQAKPDRKQWGSPDPLLEAAQKHAAEISKPPPGDPLNLNEILQRSRQFMQQKVGLDAHDNPADREMRNKRSGSGDRRPSRRSRSLEKSVNRRGRSSMSPQQRRLPARSPETRLRGREKSPASKSRRKPSGSPPSNRGKSSVSPRRKRSMSRGRSPISRAHGRASPSPESRMKRRGSKGGSPPRRRLKASRSPDTSQGRPISRGRSPEKRPRRRRSISQEPRRTRPRSRTPERNVQRSPPPKLKVVLNQSPGGTKVRVCSPLRSHKRSAERGPSAERKTVRRRLSPSIGRSPERKSFSREDPTRRPLRDRIRGDRSSEKDKTSNLKPIPHDTPQTSGMRTSRKEKDVSGYKSLSNLRNQGKDKPPQGAAKSTGGKPSIEVDLTVDSDNEKNGNRPAAVAKLAVDSDEQHGRANHRLVNERFSGGWGHKKPVPVSPTSIKKTDSKEESNISADDSKEILGSKDTQKKDDALEEEAFLEESTEFDFLNDTLDDDKESTVVDEYEEILDYQDLEENAELEAKEPNSTNATSVTEAKDSPAIDLPVNSAESALDSRRGDSKQTSADGEPVQSNISGGQTSVLAEPKAEGSKDEEGIGPVKTCESEAVSQNIDGVPDAQCSNESADAADLQVTPAADIEKSRVVPAEEEATQDLSEPTCDDNGAQRIRESSTGVGGDSESSKDVPEETPASLDTEEWNVVDSVDEHEDSPQNVGTGVKEVSHDDSTKPSAAEADASPAKEEALLETHKASDGKSVSPSKSVPPNIQDDAFDSLVKTEHPHLQISEGSGDKDKVEPGVSKGSNSGDKEGTRLSEVNENDRRPPQQASEELLPVRSVSDIEKFLLLSSQEVEAKREQVEDSGNNDKKSDVFSRLGDKLHSEEAGEPEAVIEPETPVPSTTPTKKVAASSKGRTVVAKATPKKKKAETEDPIGRLFDSKPCSSILIGPMNFLEPLHHFQNFTQKFVKKMLQEEGVKFKQVYVCHEDVTGAPYHYVIVIFQSAKLASSWYKQRKGKFKCDEKIFTQVPGHTKQKLIRGVETSMYYTEGNWFCRVCKKGNFPPRSLCFGCFQHRDPDGFSPLTILDKGPPTLKKSKYVGTPKLKFFVTKETIIESAPPLDGFDIRSIEMIMDEKMGIPAGICVFELPNYIDAGKLKKYLNYRDVEAVSVEMNERPEPKSIKVESVRMDPKVANEGSRKPSQDRSVSEMEAPDRPRTRELSPREMSLGRFQSPGLPRRCSPSPSREVKVARRRSPTPSREVRVRGRSPTPPREVRVRGRSPSLSREVRVRGRSRSLSREVRVRGPSPPPREVRVARGSSPIPPREVRVRGSSPNPPRSVRVPTGRSPSSSRQERDARGGSPSSLRSRLSRDRVRSRSPRLRSPGYQPRGRSPRRASHDSYPPTEDRTFRALSGGRTVRGVSPRYGSLERPDGYRSPVQRRSPVSRRSPVPRQSSFPRRSPFRRQSPVPRRSPVPHRSPVRRRSPFRRQSPIASRSPVLRRSPVYRSPPRHRPRSPTPPPRYRSSSPARPIKPDGRSEWVYPPPDPTNFRFEPRSGLDYDPTTTLYYEPKSCCFYNDDTNEWLEYEPRTGRYVLVR